MLRLLLLIAIVLAAVSAARAAVLEGVEMPDVRVVDGTPMRLNGIGLRTYSVFGVRIYVAGLYLEQRSDNPDTILRSPERKLLDIRFLRDIDAEEVRKAWREGFENNCKLPACYLDPADVRRFLDAVKPVHKGDETTMYFKPDGAEVTYNGRTMGAIPDPHFAETMLATFIGPVPPTVQLKRELLGDAK